MTGRWLTPNKARDLLGLTWDKFNALVESGVLVQEWKGDHYSISETSVLRQLTAREGEDLAETATGPSVRGGPKLPLDIEDEFQRGKDEA
jgi:hypothetical protein